MFKFLLWFLLTAFPYYQVDALPMSLLVSEYNNISYDENKDYIGCGIQFSLIANFKEDIKKPDSFKNYFLTGTVNNNLLYDDVSTTTIIKLAVAPVFFDREPATKPFKEFTLNFGDINTRDYMLIPSETANVIIYAKKIDYSKPKYLIAELLDSNKRLLSFSFDGKAHLNIALPKPEIEIYENYTKCMKNVVKKIEEMKGKK